MSLPAGTRLGPYEIVSPLGGGGMGEVFRARDTRLDRAVALKTLRPDIAADPDRRARFEREARAIASLTHPHICTLYDIGRARLTSGARADEDVEFLVMELLEGETLADRLQRGPISLGETLTWAMQIVDALDRAHRQGIVHRDLKPANIMLTGGGAKLLDFGLAQLRHEHAPSIGGATQTGALTAQGMILGTLQYIAPEQLEGREVDGRADLFAFGAILYEMASGQRAFVATSQAALVSAVLHSDPPRLTSLNPLLPHALERLVTGCLAKNPDDRWSSAHDLLLMLRGLAENPATGPAPIAGGQNRRREWIAWALAAAAIAAAGIVLARGVWRRGDVSLDMMSILPPDAAVLTAGEAPVVSPDGRRVAFVATDQNGKTQLYVRDRDALVPRMLAGTDDAMQIFWSPDSKWIGFFAGGRLKRIGATGGGLQALADAPVPRGGTWSRDDVIVFAPHPAQRTLRVSAAGGPVTPASIAPDDSESRWFPSFLPDGRHFLYLAIGPNRTGAVLRVASIDSTTTKDLVTSKASGVYVEPGYLLFRREESLVAQRFDPDRLELRDAPITLVEKIGFNPVTYQTPFSVSAGGVLAYLDAAPAGRLQLFDRLGRRLETAAPAGGYNSLCISGDGKRVVYDASDSGSGAVDIWAMDLPNGTPKRLTFDPAVDFYVACAPSGDGVVFSSLRQGSPSLYRLNTEAPGNEKLLLQRPGFPILPSDWSHDGKLIVYGMYSPKTRGDIWVLAVAGGEPTAFAATEAEEGNGHLSPDGRWMAYTSAPDPLGTFDVYVQPFPSTGTKWQISNGGGRQPVWRLDGKQLYYISPQRKIVAVDVDGAGTTFVAGASRVAVDTPVAVWDRANNGTPYAVTPDGERFVVSSATDSTRPITLLSNWPAMLTR